MFSTMRRVSFDPIARVYRWLEYATFFNALERCRLAHLAAVSGARRVLVLGDGDGRFLARLLKVAPHLTADAVDSSHAMLHLAEKRVREVDPSAIARVRFHQGDALEYGPWDHYDLVITHFFLDCFSEPEIERLLLRIQPHLAPEARWLVSEFAIPKRQPTALFARLLIGALYRAFGILTGLRTRKLPDYGALLRRHGFVLLTAQEHLAGLLRSELWQQ